LKEVVSADETLKLGNDTYAMAFKAFNWQVMGDLDLDMEEVHNCYHAAMFVFGFQCLMVTFVFSQVLSTNFKV